LLLLALKFVRGLIPKAIDESKQLGLPKVFDKLRMGGGKDNQRVAFAPEHVQAKFLAEGMFDELNAGSAARHLADHRDWPAAFRGLQSVPRDHQAGATIPHIQVRPEGRETKNHPSACDIPLAGDGLLRE
jgi:hypothetical protein